MPLLATTLLLAATVAPARAAPQVLRVYNGSTSPCPRGTQFKRVSQAIAEARSAAAVVRSSALPPLGHPSA
jgi:hypothetical protein